MSPAPEITAEAARSSQPSGLSLRSRAPVDPDERFGDAPITPGAVTGAIASPRSRSRGRGRRRRWTWCGAAVITRPQRAPRVTAIGQQPRRAAARHTRADTKAGRVSGGGERPEIRQLRGPPRPRRVYRRGRRRGRPPNSRMRGHVIPYGATDPETRKF